MAQTNQAFKEKIACTNLPFEVGQNVEVKSFEVGYRGAWFRCKILKSYSEEGKLYYSLKYLDYEEEEIHETQVFQRFEDEEKERLMVRPPYPPVYHENEAHIVKTDQEPVVVVHGSWKVGDLVDWQKDDCYWSGTVVAKNKKEALQIELYPPPHGEGETYKALCKDLRPSLDWSLEDGWTLPSMNGQKRQCARLVKREVKREMKREVKREKKDVCQTGKEQTERAMQQVKDNGELRLNIDESDSAEAAVHDLEELITRIKWIKGMLSPDVGEGSKPSWKYEDYRPSSSGM